jgi:hypothetical protein
LAAKTQRPVRSTETYAGSRPSVGTRLTSVSAPDAASTENAATSWENSFTTYTNFFDGENARNEGWRPARTTLAASSSAVARSMRKIAISSLSMPT